MTRTCFRAAMLAPVLFLAACATPDGERADAPRRQCFSTPSANNFVSAGPNAVHVRVGVGDIYRLELIGGCPDIDWSHRIAIRSRSSFGSTVCTGDRATIHVRGPGGRVRRCQVLTVSQLSPEQIAALPARERP